MTKLQREARLAAQRFASLPTFAIAFNQELHEYLAVLESDEEPRAEDIIANLRLHLGLSVGKPGAPPAGPRKKKRRTKTRKGKRT